MAHQRGPASLSGGTIWIRMAIKEAPVSPAECSRSQIMRRSQFQQRGWDANHRAADQQVIPCWTCITSTTATIHELAGTMRRFRSSGSRPNGGVATGSYGLRTCRAPVATRNWLRIPVHFAATRHRRGCRQQHAVPIPRAPCRASDAG